MMLGNGFTLDMLHNIGMSEQVDVQNLFQFGDRVKWPASQKPGFLSFEHTPNLWILGAQPNKLSREAALELIQKIIACANLYTYSRRVNKQNVIEKNIYLKAYSELTYYLKYLFIHYNDLVTQAEKYQTGLTEWGWYCFFDNIKRNLQEYESIVIVTYNYDIFLELLLNQLGLKFTIAGVSDEDEEDVKIKIIKPHGSISFQSETTLPNETFNINYSRDFLIQKDSKIVNELISLGKNSTISTIIPPAGDSSRMPEGSLALELQKLAKEEAGKISENDLVYICGISYWHVDRLEIDDLLLAFNSMIDLKVINPSLPADFDAVLSTLFQKFTLYTMSDILGGEL